VGHVKPGFPFSKIQVVFSIRYLLNLVLLVNSLNLILYYYFINQIKGYEKYGCRFIEEEKGRVLIMSKVVE